MQTLTSPGTASARSSSSSATTATRTTSDEAPDRPIALDPLMPSREPAGAHSLRVALSPAQARVFARRAAPLVAAGRPPCPFCGNPLDPDGHICPRANGYQR